MGWIQTYTGRRFDPFAPDPKQIVIEDIAHALSNTCRFNGHTKKFYSVAEHSFYVACLCPEGLEMWGLLHDVAEIYLSDVPAPIKPGLPGYSELESGVLEAVAIRFGLEWPIPDVVFEIDQRLLATEALQVLNRPPVGWDAMAEPFEGLEILQSSPSEAEKYFLECFHHLVGDSAGTRKMIMPGAKRQGQAAMFKEMQWSA